MRLCYYWGAALAVLELFPLAALPPRGPELGVAALEAAALVTIAAGLSRRREPARRWALAYGLYHALAALYPALTPAGTALRRVTAKSLAVGLDLDYPLLILVFMLLRIASLLFGLACAGVLFLRWSAFVVEPESPTAYVRIEGRRSPLADLAALLVWLPVWGVPTLERGLGAKAARAALAEPAAFMRLFAFPRDARRLEATKDPAQARLLAEDALTRLERDRSKAVDIFGEEALRSRGYDALVERQRAWLRCLRVRCRSLHTFIGPNL